MRGLSRLETMVLELLEAGRERFGLELVALSDGALKRGSVYVTLARMEDKGLVESRHEDAPRSGDRPGGLPRRLYRISAIGVAALGLARAQDVARSARRSRVALIRPVRQEQT
ncbi:MAG: helix-turn-helix transcriptional regulator [Deltaproteobacteria bacterium]|nr:helix-turn-helix transcriptional regulator [Deltaproteobacteria bacterium]